VLNLFLRSTFLGLACYLSGENISLVDQKLSRILESQKYFFDHAPSLDSDLLNTRAKEIIERYEVLIQNNKSHAYSRILYGKFLNQIGLYEKAIKYFSEADSLNPNVAITKQQIANHLIRSDQIIDALPFMILAAELEPHKAIYHSSLGEFIYEYQDELIQSMDRNASTLHDSMINSFQKAAVLEPENFNYSLRYAQSFEDVNISRPKDALKAWDQILIKFKNLSSREKQYIDIHRAKWMILLGRKNEALAILKKTHHPSLTPYKEKILNLLTDHRPTLEQKIVD